jgi:hypothetical protein
MIALTSLRYSQVIIIHADSRAKFTFPMHLNRFLFELYIALTPIDHPPAHPGSDFPFRMDVQNLPPAFSPGRGSYMDYRRALGGELVLSANRVNSRIQSRMSNVIPISDPSVIHETKIMSFSR